MAIISSFPMSGLGACWVVSGRARVDRRGARVEPTNGSKKRVLRRIIDGDSRQLLILISSERYMKPVSSPTIAGANEPGRCPKASCIVILTIEHGLDPGCYLRSKNVHERFIASSDSKYSKMVSWGNQPIPLIKDTEE